jgi:hypothetical protein
MSITYGLQTQSNETSWIVSPGQLVRIKRDCFEQIGVFGIIIECTYPSFGYTDDSHWIVLIDGKLNLVESCQIWPV